MAAINGGKRLAPRLTPPQPRRVWSFLCHGGRSSLCKGGEISLACSLPVRPSFSRHSRHFLGRRAGPTPGRVDGLTGDGEGRGLLFTCKVFKFQDSSGIVSYPPFDTYRNRRRDACVSPTEHKAVEQHSCSSR